MAGRSKRFVVPDTLGAWLLAVALLGCGRGTRPIVQTAPAAGDPLDELRRLESATRARTDFAHIPSSDTALGPDPYVAKVDGEHLLGLLRGRSALVELDASLREERRLPAPRSPAGMAVACDGEVFVIGELSNLIARYRYGPAGLRGAGTIAVPGVGAMRDIAVGPEGTLYIVEEHEGRLLALRPDVASGEPHSVREVTRCHGPLHVERVDRWVILDCLLDHAVLAWIVDARGFPLAEAPIRIVHDGPMWSMEGMAEGSALLLAVGGVEDHPLDRTQGSFGFVDSFVTLYRLDDGAATKLVEVNTSALGVVTPKALYMSRSSEGTELLVTGYGSPRMLMLRWGGALDNAPSITTRDVPPGTAQMARTADGSFVLANPLLDAWVRLPGGTGAPEVVGVDDEASRARRADSRTGERLFFTTLIAPWNRSDGRLSRFTCETCHFEGYVDGRTHHTGRGDVVATTKPLLGLFNNRPYFSRALDPDLTTMVDNEFVVAGANSGHDPWFSLSPSEETGKGLLRWVRLLWNGRFLGSFDPPQRSHGVG